MVLVTIQYLEIRVSINRMCVIADDFEPNSSSEDDEETIAKEECDAPQTNNSDEIERLKQESELPLEDLLKDLPDDYWNNRDKIDPGGDDIVEVRIFLSIRIPLMYK